MTLTKLTGLVRSSRTRIADRCVYSYSAPGARSSVKMFINWPLAGATILPNVGGWAAQYITQKNLKPWYESLQKPAWMPPNWLFGPAWTFSYCTIGYSSYLVWRDGGGFAGAAVPLSIYGINIALNWSWTPLFFGAHRIDWGLYDMVAIWASTIAVGVMFYQINPIAGYFVIPYFTWTTFVGALNYALYRNNKQIPEDATKKVEEDI